MNVGPKTNFFGYSMAMASWEKRRWLAVIEPAKTAYKACHPKHGNLPLDAYMCVERQEPCLNSQMIKTAHAYIARWLN